MPTAKKARAFPSEMTPEGEQLVIPGCEKGAEWFEAARKRLGMTQKQLAAALGYRRYATISDIERGVSRATPRTTMLVEALLKQRA